MAALTPPAIPRPDAPIGRSAPAHRAPVLMLGSREALSDQAEDLLAMLDRLGIARFGLLVIGED